MNAVFINSNDRSDAGRQLRQLQQDIVDSMVKRQCAGLNQGFEITESYYRTTTWNELHPVWWRRLAFQVLRLVLPPAFLITASPNRVHQALGYTYDAGLDAWTLPVPDTEYVVTVKEL